MVEGGARAKSVLVTARALHDAVVTVQGEQERLRGVAQRQYEALRAEKAAEMLRTMPVERLRGLVKGLRTQALEAAGYVSVAQVEAATVPELMAVPGVGQQTAVRAINAARRHAATVRREVWIRLDPDQRTPQQTELLRTLVASDRARRAEAAAREACATVAAELDRLEPVARRAGSRVRMFFSRTRKKAAAMDAVGQLQLLVESPAARSVHSALAAIKSAGPSDLWSDFEHNAAAYNTLLSWAVGGERAHSAEAHGFVPAEVEREAERTALDRGLLHVVLRGYQEFGAKFALSRRRSIVGDEMGLGKTIEAIAAIAHLAASGERGFLVVCPASVMVNWLNEIATHSKLRVHRLHGPERDDAVREWVRNGEVGVTTLSTLDKLSLPAVCRPALLVVDEAHFIKNPDAKRSRAVREVALRSDRVLFLTGTPMENRVSEFKSLVSYLQPQVAARLPADDLLSDAAVFRRLVASVYLRRNQEDVLRELPDKLEVEDWVEFNPLEAGIYRDAVEARHLADMRRAAYAPGRAATTAKMERLLEIVEESRENGWKVVVFSQFLAVLDAVRLRLGPGALTPLTGKLDADAKQRLVDEFSAIRGHAVLVCQIDAGGFGLNMHAASVVIIAEPQWKPSVESQAIARCHRMGQTRMVHVHRLLVKDSVDQRVREILEHKTRLFDRYARESDAKHADVQALDTTLLFDDTVPVDQRIVMVERRRLGLTD